MKALYNFSLFALLLAVLLWIGCKDRNGSSQAQPTEIAFYHWTQKLEADSLESVFLKRLQSRTLYLRYFDIDWSEKDQMPIPLSVLEVKETIPEITHIIPTVFITNSVFRNIQSAKEVEELVSRCGKKIELISQKFNKGVIEEIQFDCDWSANTQSNYFSFLEKFKSRFPQYSISATIRLHQLKYPKRTGVPPIDKGVLMVYNMGELKNWNTENSILDADILKNYIDLAPSYPVQLDIALPLFSWTVLYRDGKMKKLIVNYDKPILDNESLFYQANKNRYISLKDQYFGGHYLYKGDQLRVEEVHSTLLKKVVHQLKKSQQLATTSLIFYHLDEQVLKNFTPQELKEIHRIFN